MSETSDEEISVAIKPKIVTGIMSVEKLMDDKKFPWFRKKFNAYKPDATSAAFLKNMKKHLSFIVFAATWNHDSKELVPKFSKTMNRAGIESEKIILCFMDTDKKSKESLGVKFKVQELPTVIVLYKDRPLMKIENEIKVSIETDIADRMRKMKGQIIF